MAKTTLQQLSALNKSSGKPGKKEAKTVSKAIAAKVEKVAAPEQTKELPVAPAPVEAKTVKPEKAEPAPVPAKKKVQEEKKLAPFAQRTKMVCLFDDDEIKIMNEFQAYAVGEGIPRASRVMVLRAIVKQAQKNEKFIKTITDLVAQDHRIRENREQ